MPKRQAAKIEEVDLKPAYVAAVTSSPISISFAAPISSSPSIPCTAPAAAFCPGSSTRHGIRYVAIRQEVNPLFPGINPEPILPHVALLQETVVKEKCHAGLVTDGDADRIGAVAEDGSFVDSHKCMCVLLNWLLQYKKWPGDVVRAFNTTGMMDRIAAKYGRKLYECNIGFKYIADLMMEHEILIGGEESGGIGYGRFLPERDGILNALLLANVMAEEKKPLGQLVADLQREFGAHYYGRRDLHISDEMKNSAIRRAADPQTTSSERYTILRKGESRRREVLPRRSEIRKRRRPLGIVPRLRHRTHAALLCRSGKARAGRRNSGSGERFVRQASREGLQPWTTSQELTALGASSTSAFQQAPERDRIVSTLNMNGNEIHTGSRGFPGIAPLQPHQAVAGPRRFRARLRPAHRAARHRLDGNAPRSGRARRFAELFFRRFSLRPDADADQQSLGTPLEYYGFRLEHRYNLSNQRFAPGCGMNARAC
jgi:hypothetical protein